MKVLTFVHLSFFIYFAESNETARFKFEHWIELEGKTYENMSEVIKSFENFVATQRFIEEHNSKFKQGESSFKQRSNKFADISSDEKRTIAGGFEPPPISAISQRSMIVIAPGSLPKGPDSLDWREKNGVTPVKDQGYYCSCCYAFSGIAALESHYLIRHGLNYSFSEQQLIDCNRNIRTGNWGCLGGSQGPAYVYIENNGIQTSETYPYREDLPHADVHPCTANSSLSVGFMSNYFRIRPKDEDTLMDVVAHYGPVAAAFCGSLNSFMYYSSGVYDDPQCPTNVLSHSALIVGYGTTFIHGKYLKYWLVKNSWSSEWGEDGYIRILRGNNTCGITNYLILPQTDEELR